MATYSGRQADNLLRGAGASLLFWVVSGGQGGIKAAADVVVVGIKAYRELQTLKGHEQDGSSARLGDDYGIDTALNAWSGDDIPDLTAIYLPGPDNLGHASGIDGEGASAGYHDTTIGNPVPYQHFVEHTDKRIGDLRKRIAEKGMLHAVVYVLTSDHGQTITNHPYSSNPEVSDSHDLELRWQQGVNEQVIQVIESARPGLAAQTFLASTAPDHLGSSVIYSPNGGMSYIYTRDSTSTSRTDGSHWSTPDDVLTRDLAFELWRQSHGEAPSRPEQTYSFAGALGHDPVVLVRQTGAMADLNGNAYPNSYAIMAIANVKLVDTDFRCELISLEAMEERRKDRNWVDFARRIRNLDDKVGSNPAGTRCGDIILIADTEAGYNAVHEGDAYPGWHGGPTKADSEVPLVVASEALSVEGGNQALRQAIANGRSPGVSQSQNQDITRIIIKLMQGFK
jgi:hypothetical protein